MSDDDAVQRTNNHAALGKLSSVKAGYYQDPYVAHFIVGAGERKPPIMNRGNFIRVRTMRTLLERFLAQGSEPKQVVNLGAGHDTSFFCLQDGTIANVNQVPVTVFELDMDDVVRSKIATIQHTKALQQAITKPLATEWPNGVTLDTLELHSQCYHVMACDLRDLDTTNRILHTAGFDPSKPTLFIAECVLIYLKPEHSDALIRWAAQSCDCAVFVTYEQIRPHDPFGRTMIRNLEKQRCPLQGILAYPEAVSQKNRFMTLGWHAAICIDMNQAYDACLTPDERKRIERLEMFDEYEEWTLLQAHYCVCWAVQDNKLLRESPPAEGESPEPIILAKWSSAYW